jgi:hypothetical protein
MLASMKLLDHRTDDGSRHFARLPTPVHWQSLCDHLARLRGARIANCVLPGIAAPWVEFTYQGHRFLIRGQDGEVCLFVRDPQCSDVLVYRVATYCERLLRGGSGQRGSGQRSAAGKLKADR